MVALLEVDKHACSPLGGGEKITVFGPNGEICSFPKPDSAVPTRPDGKRLDSPEGVPRNSSPQVQGDWKAGPPPRVHSLYKASLISRLLMSLR